MNPIGDGWSVKTWCDACLVHTSPFDMCIETELFGGACLNCVYNGTQHECSIFTGKEEDLRSSEYLLT